MTTATGNGCHRTFSSIRGFDDHRRTGRCVDPATLLDGDGRPRYKTVPDKHGDTWRRNNPSGSYWNSDSRSPRTPRNPANDGNAPVEGRITSRTKPGTPSAAQTSRSTAEEPTR